MMKRLFVASIFLALSCLGALAQTVASTTNSSVSITTGNTYQAVLSAVTNSNQRRSLTVQNNNATDTCLINIDGLIVAGNTTATSVTTANGAITAAKASIELLAGGSYTRYYPYVPNGALVATCATTGSSLYVDNQ